MPQITKNWTVRPVAEDPESETKKFFIFEGPCKKCKVSNNSLIIYDLKINQRDVDESIYRCRCICCGTKHIVYRMSEVGRQVD